MTKVWIEIRPHLSPPSQVAPLNHFVLQYYFRQFRCNMNLHHDMPEGTDELTQAQVPGTDVVAVSMFEEMLFSLVAPDVSAGQNHKFTLSEAKENANDSRLTNTHVLSHCSVSIHSSYNDRIYQHQVFFPKGKQGRRKTGVCLAIVGRTLAKSKLF